MLGHLTDFGHEKLQDRSLRRVAATLLYWPWWSTVSFRLLRLVHWEDLAPTAEELSLANWWLSKRKQAFDSIVILTSWMLWREWNNRTFNNTTANPPTQVLHDTLVEASIWVQAGYIALSEFTQVVHVRSRDHVRSM
ncbi:hypothetical protein HU200_059787 [Digitaria exilis]|uniref:Uncharacterized protein n=1 Tax=Digitaria exilis TaxID=1010633 RepID=A0A835A798_9POAL|nr:hypothetical protein HU200_059787 [Digitaria exilis]